MPNNKSTNTFENIHELRKASGSESVVVNILGQNTINDGGGGFFFWDQTSTLPDDGINVVQKSGSLVAGRWIRLDSIVSPVLENRVSVLEDDISGKEDVTNKVDELLTSTITYPSSKAVIDYVSDKIEQLVSGFQGELSIADIPINDGIYIASESGEYVNAGGIEVDLSSGITFIVKSGSEFTDIVYPIDVPITGLVQEGDIHAVSGGSVYDSLTPVIYMAPNPIEFNLFAGEISDVTGVPGSSTNWLRTGKIACQENTQYTITGMGQGSSTLGTKRVFYYDAGGTYLSFIGSYEEDPLTFTTPADCAELMIQVDSASGAGADIPNSPFWDSFKIYRGDEIPSGDTFLRGEKIEGDIQTQQITSIQETVDVLGDFIKTEFSTVGITLTSGYINTSGGVGSVIPGYQRTSVSATVSMATVDDSKTYTYSGEIGANIHNIAGVCFFDDEITLIGSACTAVKVYDKELLTLPPGTAYIATCSLNTAPVIELKSVSFNSPGTGVTHVDASYAGGDSDGSAERPYVTISDAISQSAGGSILISGGDYRESLNFSILQSGTTALIAKRGERVRVLGSDKLSGFVATGGYTNVYEAEFDGTIPSGSRFGKIIYEDGNPDREILTGERHPLQKSLSYRLPFKYLTEAESIADVEVTPGSFYQDAGKVYLHTTDSSNPSSNGFSYEVPQRDSNATPAAQNNSVINLEISDLQFYFVTEGLKSIGFNNVVRRNVTVIGCNGAGAFKDDTANVTSWNDEAAFCNGDGINGHFSAWGDYQDLTDNRSMSPTCQYFDPWCHDNWDDGMSHHENHRVIVHGGLIEYNDDGGIRASNDSGYTVYDCYARKNGLITGAGEGFSVVNPTVNINRNGCKMIAFNCFSEGNAIGYAAISDSINVIELISCISRNNVNAELKVTSGAKVISRNTLATNADPSKLKVVSGSGDIEVYNDTIIE